MNKTTEKELDGLIAEILGWEAKLDATFERVDGIASDEESAYDDKSERWQEGEAGERASARNTALSAMRDAIDSIRTSLQELSSAKEDFDQA